MRRLAAIALVSVLTLVVCASAAAAPEWRSQQPLGPEGRTALGQVGDLQCWAANRCLLITGGNGGMPAGLYAYDGSGWYLYSTVCGGREGRIAWAGPDEFWTVSDLALGAEGEGSTRERVSLCHFKDGAVVASYAQPANSGGAYLPMDAAACLAPEECWFAGQRLPGTVNVGAFHLYWNGLSLSSVPSLLSPQPEIDDPGRSVVGLAYHQGALYEGVQVDFDDEAPEEAAAEPFFIHRVVPGSLGAFEPIAPNQPIDLGGAKPEALAGFMLSDEANGLWAVSGAKASAPSAPVTVLRLGETGLAQVHLVDPGSVFQPGDRVRSLAAEPGEEAIWVSYARPTEAEQANAPARLAQVQADGTVGGAVSLPAEGEGLGHQGSSGPIACPAPGQCWMATSRGWLFHLGLDPAPNSDPAMHTLITTRPADASLPTVPPTSLPEDDSGANQQNNEEPLPEVIEEPLPKRLPPLLYKLKQQLVGASTLELSFVLRAKAHVRLLALRKGRVVAKTPRYTMDKGHRSLRLRLDPKRWPTKLDLQAHAVKKKKKGGKK
ncbi:MAG TPA: hypothetical protein VMT37_01435 [Solirubrobacterales bacterium]|nr:hypothetical protein [Solirubrobacterales bacterium]